MSQSGTGEHQGWWQASDGRWYPPELHPAARPAPVVAGPVVAGPVVAGPVVAGPVVAGPEGVAPAGVAPAGVAPAGVRPERASTGGRRAHQWLRPGLEVGVALVVVAGVALGISLSAPGARRVPMSSLHVVSDPAAADGKVLVLDVTRSHQVQLSAVDPVTRSVAWQLPFGTSEITIGEELVLEPVDGVVVDYLPVPEPGSLEVTLQGVSVTTGQILWSHRQPEITTDLPSRCAGPGQICIPASGELQVLEAKSGDTVTDLGEIERSFTDTLYQTISSVPTLEEIGPSGRPFWTEPVSWFFGPGYDPDFGWDFDLRSGLLVGTVSPQPSGVNQATGALPPGGTSMNLARFRSVAIVARTGALKWAAPGSYQCSGSLDFLTTPVLCRATGTIRYRSSSASPSPEHLTLTLEGLTTRSGEVTWRRPVSESSLLLGQKAVPFGDGAHLVVATRQGLELLDVRNGALSPPAAGRDAYWCQHPGTSYSVNRPQSTAQGKRYSGPTYGGCSASGRAGTGHPTTQPPTVGVTASGMFVWVSPRGLRAAPKR